MKEANHPHRWEEHCLDNAALLSFSASDECLLPNLPTRDVLPMAWNGYFDAVPCGCFRIRKTLQQISTASLNLRSSRSEWKYKLCMDCLTLPLPPKKNRKSTKMYEYCGVKHHFLWLQNATNWGSNATHSWRHVKPSWLCVDLCSSGAWPGTWETSWTLHCSPGKMTIFGGSINFYTPIAGWI